MVRSITGCSVTPRADHVLQDLIFITTVAWGKEGLAQAEL